MNFRKTAISLIVGLAFGVSAAAQAAEIEHALLISVDGLHALDVERYVVSHPNSALAELAKHGTTYTNARTPPTPIPSLACWPWSLEALRFRMACSTTWPMTALCSTRPIRNASVNLGTQ